MISDDIEDLRKKISIAKEAVVNETDESYKFAAFKIILGNLLKNGSKTPISQVTEIKKIELQQIGDNGNKIKPIQTLAVLCNMTIDEMRNVLEFDGKKFILLKNIEEKKDIEKQISASLCILTAWKKGLDSEWILSSILLDALGERGISTLHLAKNLGKRDDVFKQMGEKKGTTYGLTTKGWQDGLELLKKLAKGN